MVDFARKLRREMTGVEAMLWTRLRRRQVEGHRIRRQAPIGPYVADFVCLARRVVIEVDGPSHNFTGDRDLDREAWLRSKGYTVLHFTPEEVLNDCDEVVAAIAWALTPPPSGFARHLPVERGGDAIATRP